MQGQEPGRVRTRVHPEKPGRVHQKASTRPGPGTRVHQKASTRTRPGYPGAPKSQHPDPARVPGCTRTNTTRVLHPGSPGSTRVELRASQDLRPALLPGGVVRMLPPCARGSPVKYDREKNAFLSNKKNREKIEKSFFCNDLSTITPLWLRILKTRPIALVGKPRFQPG